MIADKPLKRNSNIQPLSRDHHFGLLFCWKVRIGLKAGIATDRMVRYVDYFWKGHLKKHFKEEEELLFSKVDHAICDQGKNEHTQLVHLISLLLGNETIISMPITNSEGYADDSFITDKKQIDSNEHEKTLEQFIKLLEAHIRFEERVMFPFLERHLSDEQLMEIGEFLDKENDDGFADNYCDEFWLFRK